MKSATSSRNTWRVVGGAAIAVGVLAGVIVFMLALMRVFHPKVGPLAESIATGRPIAGAALAPVEYLHAPVTESAVGTVRPVHEAAVASKLLAKVVAVDVKAGERVAKDQVVVQLDDTDLRARLQQAKATATAAQAERDQARIERDRVQRLFERNSAAQIELDRAVTALKAGEAQLEEAQQAVKEAETILGYATIRSPLDGIVVDKKVDAGDTVVPGQVLLTLYDPRRMQLVASVRESLTHDLRVGQDIDVQVEALGHRCQGTVSEIVPESEAKSRSFQVKVTGPCPPGIYAGMFGRLIIPLDEEEVLVVPQTAIRRIGQLDVVEVADGEVLRRRAVQLGRRFGDKIEVLSGLRRGEQVLADAGSHDDRAS